MITYKDFEQLDELAYAGNIGIMELVKFYEKATPDLIKKLKAYIAAKNNKAAWEIVQQVTGVKLQEEREVVQLHQVSVQELAKILGKSKMTSISKNPFFREISNYEHAFKYAVSRAGFESVEVYAFHRSVHTTESGKIRPEIMVRFTLSYSGRSVIQAEKYFRKREPDENEKRMGPQAGWRFLKSWKPYE